MTLAALPVSQRLALAGRVRSRADDVARDATADFLRLHPDWLDRYGDLARERGQEDARFHVQFLAGAVEVGQMEAFRDYVLWAAGVLEARGIGRAFLGENLGQVGAALRVHLAQDDGDLVADLIEAGRDALASAPPAEAQADGRDDRRASLYLQSLLAGERRAALNVALDGLAAGLGLTDVYADVVEVAQRAMGGLWERNQITVAQEHMGTAISQSVIAHLYSTTEMPEPTRGRCVITGVEGELHQIGANMVADVLEAEGWSVRFLGTQMPHGGILRAIEEHEAGFLGISSTMLFNVREVARLIEGVRRLRADRPVRIVVGGAAFRHAPELWREIGADGFAPGLRLAIGLFEGLAGATDGAT